jgi:hypothetical protein
LAATSAFAQSSVTLSGSVNYGLARSAAHVNSVGNLKGDRNQVTLAAVEDLGGGTTVGFSAQMRFSPTSGNSAYYASSNGAGVTSGATDGRGSLFEQTKLTISDAKFGKVDLGRFTNFVGIDAAKWSLQEDSGYGANAALAINGRYSGQIQYTSPKFAGIYAQALYVDSASNKYNSGNVPGNGFPTAGIELKNRTEMNALGVSYDQGPVFVNFTSGTGLLGDEFTKVGGTYNFGAFKLALGQYHQKTDIIDIGNTNGAQYYDIKAHKTTEYGIEVPYKQWIFAATTSKADTNLSNKQTVATTHNVKGVKVNYLVSKRTILMVEAANKKNAYNPAATSATDVSLNGTSYFAGIQHTF